LVTPAHRAILVDFGLVMRLHEDRATDPGRAVGTYRYMAPEQARGEPVDLRADLYSLGATLYELLAARPPFTEQNQLQLLEAVVSRRPTPVAAINPGAPRVLSELCDRLLEKRPGDRPDDASEVASILRAVAAGLSRPAPAVWGGRFPAGSGSAAREARACASEDGANRAVAVPLAIVPPDSLADRGHSPAVEEQGWRRAGVDGHRDRALRRRAGDPGVGARAGSGRDLRAERAADRDAAEHLGSLRLDPQPALPGKPP